MYIPSTIYGTNNFPTKWRNNHDFSDDPGFTPGFAPKVKEVFLHVFTEPWMAASYVKSQSLKNCSVALIDTQEALDFLVAVGNGENVARIIVNPCNLLIRNHKTIWPLLPLEKIGALDDFVKNVASTEACPICYNKEGLVASVGRDEKIAIIKCVR